MFYLFITYRKYMYFHTEICCLPWIFYFIVEFSMNFSSFSLTVRWFSWFCVLFYKKKIPFWLAKSMCTAEPVFISLPTRNTFLCYCFGFGSKYKFLHSAPHIPKEICISKMYCKVFFLLHWCFIYHSLFISSNKWWVHATDL